MKVKSFIIFFLFICCSGFVCAQDEFFSQFYANRIFNNPVFLGDEGGNALRVSSSFRQQWSALGKPFVTTGIGLDKGWSLGNGKQVAAGLIILNDKAGNTALTSNKVAAGLSYGLNLNRNSRFSAALQLGYCQKSISYDVLRFDRQYNGRNLDERLSTGENFPTNAISEFSASAGLAYSKKIDRKNTFSVAMGFMHLNRPGDSFLGNDKQKLYNRFTLTVLGEFVPDGSQLAILPSAFVQSQGPALMVVAGALVRVNNGMDSKYTQYYTSSNILFGLHYRLKDAIIPSIHYEYKKMLLLGISYDINLSSLSVASSGRGGFELRASYRWRKSKRLVTLVD